MYLGTSFGEGGGGGGSLNSLVMISENGRDVLLIIECCLVLSLIETRQRESIYEQHAWNNASWCGSLTPRSHVAVLQFPILTTEK